MNQGCEDMNGDGVNAHDNYFMANEFLSGCHYETVYQYCGGGAASTFNHNVYVVNFPDNWDVFLDNHFNATGCSNFTLTNGLIVADGFYAGGGTANGDTSSNDIVENNRVSKAYHANGGSLGTGTWNNSATTFSGNVFDDTLASMW